MHIALLKQTFATIGFFVEITKMCTNRGIYLCNAILVTEMFCYRYSTIHNSAQK